MTWRTVNICLPHANPVLPPPPPFFQGEIAWNKCAVYNTLVLLHDMKVNLNNDDRKRLLPNNRYRGLSRTSVKCESAVVSVAEWQDLCGNQDTCHQGVVK